MNTYCCCLVVVNLSRAAITHTYAKQRGAPTLTLMDLTTKNKIIKSYFKKQTEKKGAGFVSDEELARMQQNLMNFFELKQMGFPESPPRR